jgi:hypothetical protein
MDSKLAVEQFINNCFREREEAVKRELQIHHEFRRRFYHEKSNWDSRRNVIDDSVPRRILDVAPARIGFDVVTTGSVTYCARYRVKSVGEDWLIYDVQIKCGRCQTKGGDNLCVMCGGTGWQSSNSISHSKLPNRAEQHLDWFVNLTPEELGPGTPLGSAIEHFMATHCRERTASRQKEAEIHATYRKRFYSPECTWDSKELGGPWIGNAEKIMSIARAGPEFLVITEGFTSFRLRYHLRPANESWRIWKVDNECLWCFSHGKKSDCMFCGGTIWESKIASASDAESESSC